MQANREAVRPDLPYTATPLPGPRARAVIARDHAVLSPSYTRSYPLVVASAEGAMVEDVDGNRFLDFSAGIAVVSTGHCHPRVVAAIQKQAARLIHMSGTDFYYENMVGLAERLAATLPGPRRVYFGNSGAEAIEAAMKLARYATHRTKFIAFLGAFHGRTLGALSLTASKAVQRRGFGPLIPGVCHVPYPDSYRQGGAAAAASLEAIERLFRTILPPEEVAAIVVEPVQGEGGYLVPPKGFLEDLARIAQAHGILLVFDEVQCGMGRTGKLWAWEHSGVAPDILTTAKGIASGLPLSAMIARADLMDWKPGAQASTFGGNPVAVAAALKTLDLLEESLIDNAASRRRTHDAAAGHMAGANPLGGRRARSGVDDRHRTGPRPPDQRARPGSARRRRRVVFRARPGGARRGRERHPALPAAGGHARTGGFRHGRS